MCVHAPPLKGAGEQTPAPVRRSPWRWSAYRSNMVTFWRRRKEGRLAMLEEYRQVRRLVAEDITVLGEQLSSLHVEG
jgi:hypothetical protein